jgi:arabinofuranan 3-O-arabinosyltransferase
LLPSADELVVGAVAAIPLLITAYLLVHRLHGPVGTNRPIGTDLVVYWQAAKALLAHQPVYASHLFVYPPGSLLVMWPIGLLPLRADIVPFFLVDLAAILIAGALILRTFDLPLRSPQGAITLFVLIASMPTQTTLFNGNVNGLIVLLFSGCLALATRQHWARAALCLGASLAIKPIVLPFLLVPVLFRRWRALFISVAVPVALSLAVLPFLKDGESFITAAIPWILGGDWPTYEKYSVSLVGTGAVLGVPGLVVWALRALVLAIVVALVWRRHRHTHDVPLQVVELGGIMVLFTLLDFTYAWPYYTLYLLPLFIAVFRRGSSVRNVPAMVGFFLMCSPDILLMQAPYYRHASGLADALFKLSLARQTLGMLVLLGAMAWYGRRSSRPEATPQPAAEPPQRSAAFDTA